ncbi:MAG: hypothetical protein EBQ46_00505 [Actinobacteria bacterium]|nr:hypothetical protein [Actinomycetota bacterium]
MKLLINGQIKSEVDKLPYSEALIRGDGLFESILALDDKPIALERHLSRLENSAYKITNCYTCNY